VQLAIEGWMNQVETLGALFRARFRKVGDLSDRSLGVMEDALALTPVGHAARSGSARTQIRHPLADPTSTPVC
jgi:hypothetical protein